MYTEYFDAKSDVKQDDPLFPLLFSLSIDDLARDIYINGVWNGKYTSMQAKQMLSTFDKTSHLFKIDKYIIYLVQQYK